ncbi:MAG: IS3 family transposase [Clostridia bacterium]|nr:IS3 family transposase [Clostridia bacterium]
MGKVKYSPEMKEQTVKYVLEGNKSATKVAKELGIDTNTVCRWVREYREAHQIPTYKGLIFHSDRGSQYSSKKYRTMLAENGITPSMSAPGCPYDNSCVESFFASLKKELTYRRKYDTIEELKTDIFRYIELFYNRKRLHSSLRYMSPVDYRLAHSAG